MNHTQSKVLLVSNHLPPIVDGVGDHVALLAKHLSDKGLEVHVLCSSKVNNITYPAAEGWCVHPIIGNWNSLKTLHQLIYLLRQTKPNHVMWHVVAYGFHRYGLPFFLPFLVMATRFFAQSSVFFHEVRIKINPRKWKSMVIGLPMYLIMGLTHWASSFSLTSNGGYQRLLEAYGKKALILRIPPNVPIANPNAELVQKLKEELGLAGKFVLGTFGMGIRGKSVLWGALEQLQMEWDKLAFMAIGKMPGAELQEFKINSPNLPLISTGFIDSKDIATYLKVLNLYLMLEPTHSLDQWNGSSTRSTTLATALHLGIPVLGSRGELNDSFFEQVQMPMVDSLNEKNIIEAVSAIINHETDYLVQAQKAEEQAKFDLSWPNNVGKLLELMKISPIP
jgi:glycosyltransferase involved in cell wall biosynthesis